MVFGIEVREQAIRGHEAVITDTVPESRSTSAYILESGSRVDHESGAVLVFPTVNRN